MASTDRSDFRIDIVCNELASELLLERGVAQERLGTLFEIDLNVYSEDKAIDLGALLGKPMALHVKSTNEERWFHGIVCHCAMVGIDDDYAFYQIVLRPKLWLLGESATCRVFEQMSVADIVKDMLSAGAVDFGTITSTPMRFEHCVQYRESDLHFLERLMQRWGLYYFHKHLEAKHELQVVSSLSGHANVGSFTFSWDGAASEDYQITDWRISSTLRSSNYRVAGTEHLTRQEISSEHKTRFAVDAARQLEVKDFEAVNEYPAPYLEDLAKARMQAIDVSAAEYNGVCRSLKIAVGALFNLTGHLRNEQNREYLVVAASYQFEGRSPENDAPPADPFIVSFSAIESATPFSPPVTTRKPVVQGPHLAEVVEETDENGRVKVKFHWGGPDPLQSCWARVSQNWAGKQWGGVFMPHIGHEVIVEFLDGDPDQPIVTGRVYNQESMPPLALPGDKQKSIIRDHGGNEIMMDGTDGAQQIRIYCPKHESEIFFGRSIELTTQSDIRNFVTGNWEEEIGGDQSSEVKGNQSANITGNVTTTVTGNEKRTIQQDVDEKIIGKFKLSVGADLMEFFVGAKHQAQLATTYEEYIGTKCSLSAAFKVDKNKDKELFAKKSSSVEVKELYEVKPKNFTLDVTETWDIKAKKLVQKIADEIELETAKAKVTLKTAEFLGDDHAHKPANEFAIDTKQVSIRADTISMQADTIIKFGNVFEIKP